MYYNELYHYGVKGMRWGHHKRYYEPKSNYRYSKGDVTLKKGTTFQRIATNANAGFNKGVYTSYKKADKDLYKGVLGRMRVTYLLKEKGDMKLTELTMTAGKDIHLPSKEVRIDEFKKLYRQDPKGVNALINEHEHSRYGRKMKNYDVNYINNNKNAKTHYQKFNDALAMGVTSKNGHIIQRYYDNLSKKGYDAIPDENDIRLSTFKAQAPIIMFDTTKSISKVKSRTLNASEVFNAYNRSIGKKTVRDILYRGNIGFERLKNDSKSTQSKYKEQLRRDRTNLNSKYTMTNLAEDWGKNRLNRRQIRKVSSYMDAGKTHDEAVKKVKNIGNSMVDKILTKYKL